MTTDLAVRQQVPAFPIGKRVRKIAPVPFGIRKLTGFVPGMEIPVNSIGTVVKICTAYIQVEWDGSAPMPAELVSEPHFWCCYDPVEQMLCLEPIDH